MNVTKGDKAVIIDGPSAGVIVEVGEYIAPNSVLTFKGETAQVDDAHCHWVRSLGSPIQVYMGLVATLPNGRQIKLRRTVRHEQDVDVPMEDTSLRKLTDVPADELVKEDELVDA